MLRELERAIAAQLSTTLEPLGIPVAAFPADPAQLEAPVWSTQVLLSLKRRRLQPPEELDMVRRDFRQRLVIEWEVLTEFVNLSNHEGIYVVLDACLMALSGYVPKTEQMLEVVKLEPMFMATDGFVGLAQSVYTYSQSWSQPLTYYSGVAGPQVPTPALWEETRIGLHRSRIDNLDDEVLDQVLDWER